MSHRYAVDFAVDGDVRFCSHRDMIRLFARALARAELPVRFSEGFNPHPKFSIIPPRPVGVATDCDRLVLQLTEPIEDDELYRRLAGAMPRGVNIRHARRLDPTESCEPHHVGYVVAVAPAELAQLPERISQLTTAGPIVVQRHDKKTGQPTRVDIAPYFVSLSVTEAGLAMTLLVTGAGTAKPAEVCAALGVNDDAILAKTRRVKVEWK